jgi:hypothetical protein
LSRFAGVSETGARRRNPERSEGTPENPENISFNCRVREFARNFSLFWFNDATLFWFNHATIYLPDDMHKTM